MAIDIDFAKALALVDEAIENKPKGFAYDRTPGTDCKYVHVTEAYDEVLEEMEVVGKEPGCLVGDALHRAGIELNALEVKEGSDASDLTDYLDRQGLIRITRKAQEFLHEAQNRQDSGTPWQDARDCAALWSGNTDKPDTF